MTEKPKRVMPTGGGRKGGKMFPQINLQDAVGYCRKLVSKTHTGAQSAETILPGVFGTAGPAAKVRSSALRQFNLLEGDSEAYKASELAKKISAAPDEDLPALLQDACLKAPVFKSLFETFKGDRVNLSRIRQQSANLGVHPDNLELCATIFAESVEFAATAFEQEWNQRSFFGPAIFGKIFRNSRCNPRPCFSASAFQRE